MTEATQAAYLSPDARKILEEATHYDGTPPVSDQALLAVTQGRRRLFEEPDAIGIIGCLLYTSRCV